MRIGGADVDRDWLDTLIRTVDLDDRRTHRPTELSGGQQQRVAVARALVTRPAVVFADEPTGNLDSNASHGVLDLLRRAVDEFGQTIVMVTHDATAAATADSVLFLGDGQIVDRHEANSRRDPRPPEGPPRDRPGAARARHPQAALRAHRDRRAAGRGDDLRHLRADRPDPHGLRGPAELRLRRSRRRVKPKEVFGGGNDFGTARPIDGKLIDRVRQVPGVASAAGQLDAPGGLVIDGKYQDPGNSGFLVVTATPKPFDPTNNLEGRRPRKSGEIGMLRETADSNDLKLGDRVGIATREGVKPVTVVGIYDLGGVSSLGDTGIVVGAAPDVQRWFDREGRGHLDRRVGAGGRVPRGAGPAHPAGHAPRAGRRQTGRDSAEETADEINSSIGGFLTPALLTFAGAALLVGAFIIFNTFSITVAERRASSRCCARSARPAARSWARWPARHSLSASHRLGPGHRTRAAVRAACSRPVRRVRARHPAARAELATRTIVIALLVGIGVTMLAALAPAPGDASAPVAALPRASRPGPQLPPPARPDRGHRAARAGPALIVRGLFGSGPATSRLLVDGRRRRPPVHRRGAQRPLVRAARWPRRRLAGPAAVQGAGAARARERDAQPRPHRDHRGGADGRPRARRLRRGVRQRPEDVVRPQSTRLVKPPT